MSRLFARWQLEADVPEEAFDEHITAINEAEKELTTASVLRLAKNLQPKRETPPLPKGKYDVIYADPPWFYGDRLIYSYGAAEHHYPTMTIEELCELPVEQRVGRTEGQANLRIPLPLP